MKTRSLVLFSLTALGGLTRAVACDACALYLARPTDRPGFTLTTAHQFTRMGTLWEGARAAGNPIDQYLDSHITQVALGYTRGGAWQAQFTLPYVSRRFLRPDHSQIEQGREQGLGDATLAGRYRLWQTVTARGDELTVSVLGGIKFGTGNADRLEPANHVHHHFVPSGIHEHDLALGSGSTDWLAGAEAGWQRGRWFAHAQWQRKLRHPGAYDYRYADENTWEAGVGAYLLLTHERFLALQALYSADRKGLDTLAGEADADTGASVRYLGTKLAGTLGRRLSAEAVFELPVRIRTSGTMVAPDYRIRGAVNWRF